MPTQKPKRRVKGTTTIGGYSRTRTTVTKKSGAKKVKDKETFRSGGKVEKTTTKKTYSPSGKRKTYKTSSKTIGANTKEKAKVKNIRGKITDKRKTVNKATGKRTKTVERERRR